MSNAPSLVGETGRFTIRRKLGTGELTEVYEALDRKTNQRVALKIARSRTPRNPGRAQVEHEFRALERVRHPNLTQCHELFLEDNDAFFTMELVEGTSFIDHVRADVRPSSSSDFVSCGPRGLERLRKTLPQLAAGVHALHAAGLVHRDLHPNNVRVTFGGRVVVIDYGLTISAGGPSGSALIGTATHMAPEQHEHQSRAPASDWYSVGVLLFQGLTGALPFAGDDHEMFVQKRTLAAPLPSTLVTAVPPDLDQLCRDLLERDPAARPLGPDILHRLGTS